MRLVYSVKDEFYCCEMDNDVFFQILVSDFEKQIHRQKVLCAFLISF